MFDYNASPTEEQVAAMNHVRNGYKRLAAMIEDLVPAGREKSLAFTKLQESSMWSNRAITTKR